MRKFFSDIAWYPLSLCVYLFFIKYFGLTPYKPETWWWFLIMGFVLLFISAIFEKFK